MENSIPTTTKVVKVFKSGEVAEIKEEPLKPLNEGQVLVKVAYAAFNIQDCLVLSQVYPPKSAFPMGLGFEGSGTILQVGPKCLEEFKIGEKVAFCLKENGTWSEYLVVDQASCFLIDEKIPLEKAACMFLIPGTVVSMIEEAEDDGNQAIAHTAGATVFGKMVNRVFKLKKIKTVNLISNEDEKEILLESGANYVLNTKQSTFRADFKKTVLAESVTRFYDRSMSKLINDLLILMPPMSTTSFYGNVNESPESINEMRNIGDYTVTAIFLNKTREEKAEIVKFIQSQLVTTMAYEIEKVFKFTDFMEAYKYYKETRLAGRVVLSFSEQN